MAVDIGDIYGTFTITELLSKRPYIYGCKCECGDKKPFKVGEIRTLGVSLFCSKCSSSGNLATIQDTPENTHRTEEEAIREMLAGGDALNAVNSLRSNSILTLLELLPIAEDNYRATRAQHAAYAYTNLHTQLQTLLDQLEGSSKSDTLILTVDCIVVELRKGFMSLGQQLVDTMHRHQTAVVDRVEVEDRAKIAKETTELTIKLGGVIEDTFTDIKSSIITKLKDNQP